MGEPLDLHFRKVVFTSHSSECAELIGKERQGGGASGRQSELPE